MTRTRHAPKPIVWLPLGLVLLLVALSACAPAATATAVPMARTPVETTATATATLTATAEIVPTSTATSVPTATGTAVPTASTREVGPTSTPTAIRTVAPTATLTPSPPTATPTELVPPPGDRSRVYTVVGVASDDVLNVRQGPGVAHPIVGALPAHGMGVQIAGEGERVDGALWVPVRYGEIAGWVNSNYLARQVGAVDAAVAARAAEIILALRDRDWEALSRFVHPDKGVRFSPYTYVRPGPGPPEELDLVFSADEVRGLASDLTVYHWGWFDGSGQPIELDFLSYSERFIYDADFARPDVVGYGRIVGQGNTINNIAEVYPEAVTVEYHFEGFDPQFQGLDWRSLRLVLEGKGGTWYLVGVVHDEWTI